jgi:hypothetical protein
MDTHRFAQLFLIVFGLLACTLLARPASAQVICFDGTFDGANYSDTVYTTDPSEVTTTASPSTNGNPGTALEVLNTWSVPNITFTTAHFLINQSCAFDPAKQGGLQGLDFSIDRNTSGTGVILGGTQNGRPLLWQGGNFYVATVVGPTLVPGVYSTIFGAGLTAADFVGIDPATNVTSTSAHPDFSSSGGPIQFGVYSAFGHINPSSDGGELIQLYDNLSYLNGSATLLKTPGAQEIAVLTNAILSYDLPHGTTTSLYAKLKAALADLEAGNTASACSDLTDLINESQAQSGKHLTADQATAIISAATQARNDVGCGL